MVIKRFFSAGHTDSGAVDIKEFFDAEVEFSDDAILRTLSSNSDIRMVRGLYRSVTKIDTVSCRMILSTDAGMKIAVLKFPNLGLQQKLLGEYGALILKGKLLGEDVRIYLGTSLPEELPAGSFTIIW
ncbi:MAG TPA: hypothetical protein VG982_01135 [Candidatus Paceibacterota bacterium]|jgi:hypothetical protein|nr:hypothetical protein [Candidatus Paceibacterota bacterium]